MKSADVEYLTTLSSTENHDIPKMWAKNCVFYKACLSNEKPRLNNISHIYGFILSKTQNHFHVQKEIIIKQKMEQVLRKTVIIVMLFVIYIY